MAANNVVSSPHIEYPLGVYVPGTARATRITELLSILFKNKMGEIEYEDMMNILEDTVDLYAVKKKRDLIKIVHDHLKIHEHRNTVRNHRILSKLAKWNGDFAADLEEPTYFSMWEYYIMNNILSQQIKDKSVKNELLSHFHSDKFYMRLYSEVSKDPNYKQEICSHYNTVEINSCSELITQALLQAIDYLDFEKEKRSILWGDFHPFFYVSIPFSMTPLASFFERYAPGAGNLNTVKMTLYNNDKFDGKLKSVTSANLKMMTDFGGDTYYSIDTGLSENPLSYQYFNWNERHGKSDLFKLVRGEELEKLENSIQKEDL